MRSPANAVPRSGVVLVQRLAGSRRERDAEGRVLHRDAERPRRDDRLLRADLEGRTRVAEVLCDDRIGMVPTELLRGRDAHAHDVGGQHGDRRDGLLAPEQQRLAGALGRRKRAERAPAARAAGLAGEQHGERDERARLRRRQDAASSSCDTSPGTTCAPFSSQTVIASTGQASHAARRRARSTASGCLEDGEPLVVEHEGFRRALDAVAEADAQVAVDADPQPADQPLLELGHATCLPGPARAGPCPSPRG